MTFEGDEWWGLAGAAYNLYGQQHVKGFGNSTATVLGGGAPSRVADTTAVTNSQYLANGAPTLMGVQYLDGSYGNLTVSWPAVMMAAIPNSKFYEAMLTDYVTDPNVGNNPGSNLTKGRQFYGSSCVVDMGTPAAPHVLNRFCTKGSPENTGAAAGWEWDTWNGTAWVNAFSVASSGIGGTASASVAQIATVNNFTQTNTFPDVHSNGATIGCVAIGNLSNWVMYSNDFSNANWAYIGGTGPYGTFTFTTGQPDPCGGTTATQFVSNTTNLTQYQARSYTNNLPAGTYNVCAMAKGANGGEVIYLGTGQAQAPPITLTNSYTYQCGQVTDSAASAESIFIATRSAETFTISCVSTTASGNATGCLVIGATAILTPTPGIAIAGTMQATTPAAH
jgi:hypothetical protein